VADLKVVSKIEDGTDRREVHHTTYQMRNTFKQFADGVASELDVHCYLQHAAAADLCPKGGSVLDVCCGRGLLLPFLRYRGSAPSLYVGVDAEPRYARWKDGADPRRESAQKEGGWSFKTVFVESLVDDMFDKVHAALAGPDGMRLFDLIVYTSAIEHMQPTAQASSLVQCGKLAHPGTLMYLSCPITEPGRSGYDAQYAAHVYEPTEAEIATWLNQAGWRILSRTGLCTGSKTYRRLLSGRDLAEAERIYRMLPREFALPTIAALLPASAQEVAYVCGRRKPGLFEED
jgi:2-polyprenyl-3-methyl-5-hydroxy-6-metoxy-1,4-benzoquinol methylase